MPKIISPQVEYATLLAQVKQVTPEIFTAEGGFLNLMEGRWQEPGQPREFRSPIDGTVSEIAVKVGESVESKDLLMRLVK